MTLFLVLGWFLGRRLLERLTDRIRRLPISQPLMAFVLLVTFLYAFSAEYFGRVAAITGAYLAGLLFAQTRFKKEIDRGIHPITYSLFVPIFFVDIGLQANGREILGSASGILFCGLVVLVAILGKVVGCGALARISGFNWSESLRVGIGMISRGEVGLIVAGYGLAAGVIQRQTFSMMVVMVLATTMVTPVLLRMVFPGKPAALGEPGSHRRIDLPRGDGVASRLGCAEAPDGHEGKSRRAPSPAASGGRNSGCSPPPPPASAP